MSVLKYSLLILLLSFITFNVSAQNAYELNSGWKTQKLANVHADGQHISQSDFDTNSWLNATIPGTVLTTLLNNKLVPDPFWGMNNNRIKDIYSAGRGEYTYWFVKDFVQLPMTGNGQAYLNLRGVNYSCEVFLNGRKLNKQTHYGMFLRQSYNITPFLNKNGRNRLAVIVYPPDPVGNPNGGQGGDGQIAKNVGIQYSAGWDWIQPMRDRNTGIWDKVTIETTGAVRLTDPHVVTLVPGARQVEGIQQPAIIKSSATLSNPTAKPVSGTLLFAIDGQKVVKPVVVKANSSIEVSLADLILQNPKLWWPNGYGDHHLYKASVMFV